MSGQASLACGVRGRGPRRSGRASGLRGQRAFGQPAIRNVRTDALAEEYRAGTSRREELADLYDLATNQIDEAIRFELIAGSERAS